MSMIVEDAIRDLLTPEAVRERCLDILNVGEANGLEHFSVNQENFDFAIELVLEEMSKNYPEGNIPFHSRWRHFEFGSNNLWTDFKADLPDCSTAETARRRIDLAVVSVLLDAGAGPQWCYSDKKTGMVYGRSEGLAIASIRLVESGALSYDKEGDPRRVDACALSKLSKEELSDVFQVNVSNPLVGVKKRADLLNRLGREISLKSKIFLHDGTYRPGNIYDYLVSQQKNGSIEARDILVAILNGLSGIWPDGEKIAGVPVGDVGFHQVVVRKDITNGILPFHKLSQWMAYSLIEPLEDAGIKVVNLDNLTGLAEYRNGGLFLDTKVLTLKNVRDQTDIHDPKGPLVTEWRGLTVALLDKVAVEIRRFTGKTAETLPLASVLQGGTWSAGRKIAKTLRKDGGPPLILNSKGTIF